MARTTTSPPTRTERLQVAAGPLAGAVRQWLAAWRPRKRLTLSQWSGRNARLVTGARYRAFPFQDGIADAFTDPAVPQITVKKSSRIGYSQIVQNYVGYCIDQAPTRLLIYQPTIDDAESYAKDGLGPGPAMAGDPSPGAIQAA